MAILAPPFARVEEQRRHPRVSLPVSGRFILDDGIEHRCRTIDMSPCGVALMAQARGAIGQRVVCYLEEFGRLEGRIVRLFDTGFAVDLAAPAAKREKLAQQLACQAGRPRPARVAREPGAYPHRTAPHRPAPEGRATMRLPDGRRARVQVIDRTATGAAVICPVPVAIGAPVVLDERPARVMRVTQALVGLQFDDEPPGA